MKKEIKLRPMVKKDFRYLSRALKPIPSESVEKFVASMVDGAVPGKEKMTKAISFLIKYYDDIADGLDELLLRLTDLTQEELDELSFEEIGQLLFGVSQDEAAQGFFNSKQH